MAGLHPKATSYSVSYGLGGRENINFFVRTDKPPAVQPVRGCYRRKSPAKSVRFSFVGSDAHLTRAATLGEITDVILLQVASTIVVYLAPTFWPIWVSGSEFIDIIAILLTRLLSPLDPRMIAGTNSLD